MSVIPSCQRKISSWCSRCKQLGHNIRSCRKGIRNRKVNFNLFVQFFLFVQSIHIWICYTYPIDRDKHKKIQLWVELPALQDHPTRAEEDLHPWLLQTWTKEKNHQQHKSEAWRHMSQGLKKVLELLPSPREIDGGNKVVLLLLMVDHLFVAVGIVIVDNFFY